jgi:hypothetical protein
MPSNVFLLYCQHTYHAACCAAIFGVQLLYRHELAVPCASQATLEVLELFDDSLLLKQPLGPLRIYNVSDDTEMYITDYKSKPI